MSVNNAAECEKHELRYDNANFNPASAANREAMACHETGHTLGLSHDNGSCMQDPFSGIATLDSTHQNYLTAAYGYRNLRALESLNSNAGSDSLVSPNGYYSAIMQSDGNFVLYDPWWGAVWATGTYSPGAYLVMQEDGNLVLYNGPAIWSSGTSGNYGAYIVLQNDRNMVIYRSDGVPLWSTGTNI